MSKSKDVAKLNKKLAKILVAVTELQAQLEDMDEENVAEVLKIKLESGELLIIAGKKRFAFQLSD